MKVHDSPTYALATLALTHFWLSLEVTVEDFIPTVKRANRTLDFIPTVKRAKRTLYKATSGVCSLESACFKAPKFWKALNFLTP